MNAIIIAPRPDHLPKTISKVETEVKRKEVIAEDLVLLDMSQFVLQEITSEVVTFDEDSLWPIVRA